MQELLRQIPKTDDLLAHPLFAGLGPTPLLTMAARQVLDKLRGHILSGAVNNVPNINDLADEVARLFAESRQPNLRRVINATGIILHTNLGRGPLAKEALCAIAETARGYSTLEYDLNEGKRSSRHSHVEALLTQLTGAEAAMVVNNNAAAVLLALSALAAKRDVLVSRGELVEIGGSFRVPDVLRESGCCLVEVGTTNKTYPHDYENGINQESTGALLRVHTSNFKIVGFVATPTLEELALLAKKHSILLIEDLGSGCMINLEPFGIYGQPVVGASVKAGADIITFSGDKLLGGPQAGIIVGRAKNIAILKKHPLARAMRIDKLSLAALEATLRLYLDPKTAVQNIPVLRMLCAKTEVLEKKACILQSQMGDGALVVPEHSQAGGGAMPGDVFASYAVSVDVQPFSAQAAEQHFRAGKTPIIGRIAQNRFLLDVRTINEEDLPLIAARFKNLKEGAQ